MLKNRLNCDKKAPYTKLLQYTIDDLASAFFHNVLTMNSFAKYVKINMTI